jgi:hypothetical protein
LTRKKGEKKMAKQRQEQSPADQFSDEDMERIKHYGEALGGKATPFDEEVERHLEYHERHYAKMRAVKKTP